MTQRISLNNKSSQDHTFFLPTKNMPVVPITARTQDHITSAYRIDSRSFLLCMDIPHQKA